MEVAFKNKLSLRFPQCTKKSTMKFRKTSKAYLISQWLTQTLNTVLSIELRKSQNFKLLRLPNDLEKQGSFLVQEPNTTLECRPKKHLQQLAKKPLETWA